MDLSNFAAIRDIIEPKLGLELCQFVQSAAWMGLSIPRFVGRAAPLYRLSEGAYRKVRKRTRRDIAKINATAICWVATHTAAVNGLHEQLRNAVRPANSDLALRLCVFTEKSDAYWDAVIKQREYIEMNTRS